MTTAADNFLDIGSAVTWIVIISVVTPVLVAVLVLVLVRLLMKRAGTGLPQALGSAAGGGMAQPTRGTMHVVAASVMDRNAMIAPCTIAYAIEAPGIPAFSGQGSFYAQTKRWPQPGAQPAGGLRRGQPGARRHRLGARAAADRHGERRRAGAGRPAQPAGYDTPARGIVPDDLTKESPRQLVTTSGTIGPRRRSVVGNSEA